MTNVEKCSVYSVPELNFILKMIFSVQISNRMYTLEFSPDLVQIQVRETVSEVFFGANGHLNLSLALGGGDVKGFQRTSNDPTSHDREPIWRNANVGGNG